MGGVVDPVNHSMGLFALDITNCDLQILPFFEVAVCDFKGLLCSPSAFVLSPTAALALPFKRFDGVLQ